MLQKTRGIVFHTTDYSETSIIAKIYTESFGVQSCLVNGVRKRNAKTRSGIFQPLSLVELVFYHKERGGIQRVSEIRNAPQYNSIPFDMQKSSMVLFLNEVMYRCVREEEANAGLFEFIYTSLQLLDLQHEAGNDFHVLFLIRLTRYLGFFPNGQFAAGAAVFDLQEGTYGASYPPHPFFLDAVIARIFDEAVRASSDLSKGLNITSEERRVLIERLLEYYRLHVDGFGEIRSHKILEEVWGK